LFVAAYPSPTALDDLQAAVAGLGLAKAAESGINPRLTARPLWHVTLAFLGDVADGKVGEASRAVDRTAERAARPQLRIAGGGRFGRGKFTVVWVGLGGDLDGLGRVAGELRRELDAVRVRYDTKRFNPHLTLARPGNRLPAGTIAVDIETLASYRGPLWTITELALMASHLGPHPRHEMVHRAPLA
jgi:2'-5' RNA ligase